MLNYITLAKFM